MQLTTRLILMHTMQLEAVSAERDGLYEDVVDHQASKRTVDKQLCMEKEKSARLEAELAFYRTQRLRPLSDQDKARPVPTRLILRACTIALPILSQF